MARYQIPPDPRKGDSGSSHAQKIDGRTPRSSPPWLWIGLGAIVTVLAIAVAVLWAQLFLEVQPAQTDPSPAPVVNTATPTPRPVAPTVMALTPTPLSDQVEPTTVTTIEGEQPAISQEGIIIGGSVTVIDTGVGLNLRAEPVVDPDNILGLIPDGTLMEVIGGPKEDGTFIWWQLRSPDELEGWAVQDFLQVP